MLEKREKLYFAQKIQNNLRQLPRSDNLAITSEKQKLHQVNLDKKGSEIGAGTKNRSSLINKLIK